MNYSRISGLMACKMAMLLAFMFAACSDEPSVSPLTQDGGYTEEQGVYALAGRVGDIYPKLMKAVDSTKVKNDTLEYEGSIFAAKGAVVTVYELDSLTFDTTGRSFVDTVDNDDGHFEFKDLALNSPYVLIESRDSCYYENCGERGIFYGSRARQIIDSASGYKYPLTLSAIVDLRQVKKLSVSTLTSVKIPLLREFIAEGKSFEEANRMAERKILENFAIYNDLGTFETMDQEGSELPYVNELARMDNWDLRVDFLSTDVVLYFASPKAFSNQGAVVEQFYLNSMKMLQYKTNYLAKKDGLGRCDESRENVEGKVKAGAYEHKYASVVCRSGNWTVGFKTVEHTNGTMEDNRDGKTYKTVTYNWADGPQTWMAENLDYADTTSLSGDSALKANLQGSVSCYRSARDDENCDVYGLAYQWRAAMNVNYDDARTYTVDSLGDTTYVEKNCVDGFLNDWKYPYDSIRNACDTLYYPEDRMESLPYFKYWTWNYADYVARFNQNAYKGVCPDGWRMPTFNDWKTLLKNVTEAYEAYGFDYAGTIVLFDEAATGFGLKNDVAIKLYGSDRVRITGVGFYNNFLVADVPMYVLELFELFMRGESLDIEMGNLRYPLDVYEDYLEHPENRERGPELPFLWNDPYAPYTMGAVRCIKE